MARNRLVQNNGVALARQSSNGDSARAGQAFNDYAYVGVSSANYGVLTVGRQRTLTTDDRSVYDPIAGSLAFSLLGYTGSLSSGDTENTRFRQFGEISGQCRPGAALAAS